VGLNRALCRAAAFVLGLVGIGCSEPEGPTPQAWADGEVQSIKTLQHNSGHLSFTLPSLKNEWSMKHLTDDGVAALLAHPELPTLESLNFMGVNITEATVRAVVASPKSRTLGELGFGFAPLGDAGLEAIAAWPGLGTVQSLAFNKTGATDVGLKALAGGPYGQDLPGLSLNWQSIGDSGAEVLSTMKMRGPLSVKGSLIGGSGAQALIKGAPSPSIDLKENPIGPGGLVGLEAIGEGLRALVLDDCQLGPEDIAALAGIPAPGSFVSLSLASGKYGDAGLRSIAQAPWLSQLEMLYIDTDASDTAQGELRTAWGDRKGLNVDGVWSEDPEPSK
jgi:hypothetical protein